MAIATATASSLEFDSFDRLRKPVQAAEGPAVEALRACPQLVAAPIEVLRSLARQSTLRSVPGTTPRRVS